jgi:hypothetical protein
MLPGSQQLRRYFQHPGDPAISSAMAAILAVVICSGVGEKKAKTASASISRNSGTHSADW